MKHHCLNRCLTLHATRRFLALLIMFLAPDRGRAAENGLVAHYDFNEGSGVELKDQSGNGCNGEIHDAKYVKEPDGYALKFDGVKDYVDCGTVASGELSNAEAATIEAWLKPDAVIKETAADAGIVIQQGLVCGLTYDLRTERHKAWFYINAPPNYTGADVEPEVWQHLVGVFDGNTLGVYVDGELKKTITSNARTINANRNHIYIGRQGDQYFQGLIDEVRIYNRALSEAEVASHYQAVSKAKFKK
ncbi:MAG: LamG domain-containing protein [Verrucomicrobia bacterium]|nr:LamG domain-containing protein [Verrucomicrobiota bacterium]